MNINETLKGMKTVASYAIYVVLAWVLLFIGLLVFPILGQKILMEIIGGADPTALYTLTIVGPFAMGGWIGIAYVLSLFWPYVAFIIWAIQDNRKFKAKGVSTHPYLWGAGMIFPLILAVFPLYLIRRNISWVKKPATQGSAVIPNNYEIPKKRTSWTRIAVIVAVVLFIVIPILSYLLMQAGMRNRTLGNFLVNSSLKNSCGTRKSGCDELAPLPKVLQNKKIIFNEDVSVEFDARYEPEVKLSDIDVLGFINTTSGAPIGESFVDPKMKENGLLLEKEYRIVRAVRVYRCSYCVGGSNLAYIVLEDSRGNRFEDILDDSDSSVSPWVDIPWDEQLPYSLGRDGEFGKLVDVD